MKRFVIEIQMSTDIEWHHFDNTDSMVIAMHLAADAMNQPRVVKCQIRILGNDSEEIIDLTPMMQSAKVGV